MSENVKNTETNTKPKISEKNLAVIITAAILAVVFIAAAIVSVISIAGKDYGFDYLKSDLSKYVKFSESYKDYKLEIDIAKSHDIDVDVAILNLIYQDRTPNKKYEGETITSAYTISAGDTVNIWYRGYLLDEEGNEISVDGMCNFGDSSPYALNIGSGYFVPGFELNMIGLNTGDYSKFEKITEGRPFHTQIAYVSYSLPSSTDSTKKVTYSDVRMDLTTDLDAIYGEGFKEKLLEFNVGDKKDIAVTLGDTNIIYSDLTLEFITDCESNPMVVECYFGYDYSETTLRNETAYFEVYVDGLIDYECPEFNSEYVEKLIEDKEINLTLEELNEYEGANSEEKYRSFVQASLDEIYEETYKSMLESAIWERLSEITTAIKHPGYIVDDMYDYYMDELRAAYTSSGGQVYSSSTGQYTTYESLSKYIPAYLGLSSSQNYKTYLTEMAEDTAKERMAMFYILRAENLLPTDAELAATVDEIKQEYVDEYVEQYLRYEGKTKDDYTDEEYADFVEDCARDILGYYDDEYFTVKAYQRIFAEKVSEWPEVSTLDDRRAYPLDK